LAIFTVGLAIRNLTEGLSEASKFYYVEKLTRPLKCVHFMYLVKPRLHRLQMAQSVKWCADFNSKMA